MSDWVTRYLRLLNLPSIASAPADADSLERLCYAQVTRVPFENITAILRRAAVASGPVPPLDTDVMLALWEAGAGGGVCVDAAPTFRRLLVSLGYNARAALAQISFPGSHQASIVDLDGVDYLVDVANGAPFLEPIPLDRETIVTRAGLGWRFRRAAPDLVVQDRFIDKQWLAFCRYTVPAALPEEVEAAYQRHHVVGESFVVSNLTLVSSSESEVVRLRDRELVRYTPDGVRSEIVAEDDLPRVAADVFHLPALPIAQASTALEMLRSTAAGAA
jgi:arylamine N-acetyltransferase